MFMSRKSSIIVIKSKILYKGVIYIKKDLTNSNIGRQNILNNQFALSEIQKASNLKGIVFEDRLRFTKDMCAEFYDVDIRTISRYVEQHSNELISNGYEVLKGNKLKLFLNEMRSAFGKDIDVPTKITILGIFDFRAFLNLGMLLTESENARTLRQMILDVVIDTVNQKTGGGTKYINQRDEDFIGSWLQEENYRRQFTDALRDYVDMDNFKYALYTDKIYQSIFKEKSKEYKEVLKLKANDKVRDTFYSEVLDLVASYECGLAEMLKQKYESLSRKLSNWEVDALFKVFEHYPHWKPLIDRARNKMASRDLAFRDALHMQLKDYVTPVNQDEYYRFLGEKSKALSERLDEAKDALERLKERG
jgi:hypothetical protein